MMVKEQHSGTRGARCEGEDTVLQTTQKGDKRDKPNVREHMYGLRSAAISQLFLRIPRVKK